MSSNENEWDLETIIKETRILEEKNNDLKIHIEFLKEKKRKLRDAARARESKKM